MARPLPHPRLEPGPPGAALGAAAAATAIGAAGHDVHSLDVSLGLGGGHRLVGPQPGCQLSYAEGTAAITRDHCDSPR